MVTTGTIQLILWAEKSIFLIFTIQGVIVYIFFMYLSNTWFLLMDFEKDNMLGAGAATWKVPKHSL